MLNFIGIYFVFLVHYKKVLFDGVKAKNGDELELAKVSYFSFYVLTVLTTIVKYNNFEKILFMLIKSR